jgi:hypothetical protein
VVAWPLLLAIIFRAFKNQASYFECVEIGKTLFNCEVSSFLFLLGLRPVVFFLLAPFSLGGFIHCLFLVYTFGY